MARARYNSMALTADGLPVNIVPNATVTLYEAGTTTPLADTIYAGATGGSTLTNPFTADAYGNFTFYLADRKRVKIVVTGTGLGTYTNDHEPVLPAPDEMLVTTLPTPLTDVGIGLNAIDDYSAFAWSEIKGGGGLQVASGRHANSYGSYAPVVVSYPQVAYLSYVTPDIADTSTSGGETTGNHSFALVRTGSGLLPGMAAGSTGAQAAAALTITAVAANSVTVSGLTTANTTDYVGWHFLVTTGSAAGIARKITAHTASASPVFTLDSATSWGTTPSTNDKATLNYGQTVDLANVLSTFRDDSSMVSAGGAHTTKGFGAYGRNTATSTGYVQGFFGLLTNYSANGVSIGSELDVGNSSNYAHRYWNGGASRSSAGLIVAGTRGTYESFTAGTVSTTTIQKSGASWTVNEHTGKGIYVASGTQIGSQRIVTSNTSDTLTFTPAISTSGLSGASIHLGSLWNGAAIAVGTTGAAAASRGAGWLHGIQFDDYAFAEEGAFGIDFKPSSGVDFPIRIPNGTALFAWKTGETWAGTYPAGTAYTATHGHVPLIGTAAGGNVTYIGTDTQMVLVSNTTGAFGSELARLGAAGLQLLKGSGGTPAANYLLLYPKPDDNLYKQTSAGDEVRLLDADVFSAAGQLIYGTGAETFAALAAGTSSQVLIGGTTPSWGSVSTAMLVADAATQRGTKSEASYNATTTSGTFVVMKATAIDEMAVTLTTTGGDVMAFFSGVVGNASSGGVNAVGFSFDGVNTTDLMAFTAPSAGAYGSHACFFLWTGVSAASHTVKVVWRVNSGTASAYGRTLIVMEFKK